MDKEELLNKECLSNGLGGSLKDHMEEVLKEFLPDQSKIIKRMIVKTMLALLKIRSTNNYELAFLRIMNELEEGLKIQAGLTWHLENIIRLVECKSIAYFFPRISITEAKEIEVYIRGLISWPDDTLERYMADKFKSRSALILDPDCVVDDQLKIAAALRVMTTSLHLENFTLITNERIDSDEIDATIIEYYESRGYALLNKEERPSGDFIYASKEEDLRVWFTNFGREVLITVKEL